MRTLILTPIHMLTMDTDMDIGCIVTHATVIVMSGANIGSGGSDAVIAVK